MADRDLNIIIKARNEATATLKKTTSQLDKVSSKIKNMKPRFQKMAGYGSAAFGALFLGAKKEVEAYGVQEQAEARLAAALKNQNNYSQENFRALTKLASARQQLTIFGDEETISSQALAASYKLNTDQLLKATPVMQDLATMTAKASGSQADMENGAKLLGKA